MKRKLYFILPVFLFSFSLPEPMDAQTKWSLSDCIQYALDHNLDIKRQQTEIDRQAIQQQTNSLSRLPNVMAGSTQKFDFGRSLNRDNTYNDVNSQNSAFSLSTETSLFEGLKTVHTIERQKIELKVHQTNLDKIKNNLSMTIAVNYFQILLNK